MASPFAMSKSNGITLDPCSTLKDENEKLNKRLLLLRDEYVKLQTKLTDLQSRYDRLASTTLISASKASLVLDVDSTDQASQDSLSIASRNNSFNNNPDNDHSVVFVKRVVEFIGSLFNNSSYSDLLVEYKGGGTLFAHKFVLLFRSSQWGVPDLNTVDRINFPNLEEEIAIPLFQWIYTGFISGLNDRSEDFILDMVRYSVRFNLTQLVELCEEALIGFVCVENCIYFYQVSEELSLTRLCEYSSKLVSIYWDSLTESDFSKASTQFLHRLFKEKSRYPLHKAIRIANEDLIFLLLVDFDSQLAFKVNEFDTLAQIPLDLALRSGQYSIAKSLIEHQANVNATDSSNWPLLHRYIAIGQLKAAKFLIEHGASVGNTNPDSDTPLHMCAIYVGDNQTSDEILNIAQSLIDKNVDINLQNKNGDTALHRCIVAKNYKMFDLLLNQAKINLDIRNRGYQTPFALALEVIKEDDFFAKKLLTKGVSLETINPENGDSLLHISVRQGNEKAALFLVENGANVNTINNRGETILHLSSYMGLKSLVSILLQKNANCNLLTLPPFEMTASVLSDENAEFTNGEMLFNQTPLHLAIMGGHESIIKEILSYHDRASRKGLLDSALLMPDLNIKNSKHQTPLSLAIELRLTEISEMLIQAGADVDVRDEDGYTLLHKAIMDKDIESAHFLILHGADTKLRSNTGETYLQYAVRNQLGSIVQELCCLGCDVNINNGGNGNCVLWEALTQSKSADEMEIPSILVRFKCDTDCWHDTGYGFRQTLLHRALDENNQEAAIFLIRSGCDIHSVRKPGVNGEGTNDCDGQTPLHMACSWGMTKVVETLLEHSVDPNISDNEGKTALHVAILNHYFPIVDLLLQCPSIDLYKSDNYGNSPFSFAIKQKSRETAQALCRRDPMVVEQRDGKGRNFLHLALQKNDYDSVLFLLDNKVDVNARVGDSTKKFPIHLAAETGSEIILRTLVLAGCSVNDLTMQNQTALHLAAELNKHQIVEILFDLNVDAGVQDINGNNAFHLACLRGHLETCRILIERKLIDTHQTNYRGQNIVHCLAVSSNKSSASAIFDLLVQSYSDLALDARDLEGNTALLLAYMNGNGNLCRSIVREGASLGIRNNHGVSIFNHVMPTRQLLTSLLDTLSRMPEWRDGPECLECGIKFNITNRRHHCRHCGRELCARCSSKEMIIMKFQQDKKSMLSRVCELCYEVLTLGVFN